MNGNRHEAKEYSIVMDPDGKLIIIATDPDKLIAMLNESGVDFVVISKPDGVNYHVAMRRIDKVKGYHDDLQTP